MQMTLFSRYRIIKLGVNRVIMQGTFSGAEDIRAYLMKRIDEHGADENGTYRLEQDINGKWTFETNITVSR